MAQATGSVLFETALLSMIRGIFFLACRHYVNLSLFSGLRSVIHEDATNLDSESPDPGTIQLDDAENGYFAPSAVSTASGKGKGRARSNSIEGNGGASGSSNPLLSPRKSQPNRRDSGTPPPARPGPGGSSALPKLATSLFCLCFSESCMLFTLVLFGEAVGDRCVPALSQPLRGPELTFFVDAQSTHAQLVDLTTCTPVAHHLHHPTRTLRAAHSPHSHDHRAHAHPHARSFRHLPLHLHPRWILHRFEDRRRGLTFPGYVSVARRRASS